VCRFLTANQHNYTTVLITFVHAGKYVTEDKKTDNTEIKHNPEQANNTKHSKTKLPWFSRLLWCSARKQCWLIHACVTVLSIIVTELLNLQLCYLSLIMHPPYRPTVILFCHFTMVYK